MTEEFKARIMDLQLKLMSDLDEHELSGIQVRVDSLMKLAMMDGGHDHDTQGGVGHHDHTALADLSWRLDPARLAAERSTTRGE
jgi:hypothetical protein